MSDDDVNLPKKSAKNDQKKKKNKPQSKPGRKMTPAQKVKNLDENVIKQVLKEKKEEMSIEASKIAKEMAARMDLQIDTDVLSDLQKSVAIRFGSGYTIDEIEKEYDIATSEFKEWMKNPAFAKLVTESIYDGLVDKGERVRAEKRMLEKIRDAIFEKMELGDHKGLTLPTLIKMWQDLNVPFSDKVDEKKEDSSSKDVSVLIVNYFKNEKNKDYDNLDAFLNDPAFNFNKFIDIESEEINDN